MSIRVRFAPSPTGNLHIGNARTALFNWLYVRHHGGKFVFRIEDTDLERSTRESEVSILEDIRWLGMDWDEGVDVGGDVGPYRQSERTALYEEHRDRLLNEGKAYRCYCTVEELDAMKEAQKARKEPARYEGKCRSLSDTDKAACESAGKQSVVRLRVEQEDVHIQDLVRGEVHFDSLTLGGDFVLFRSAGGVMYNFAVVVDDVTMNITHVLRGEDHLTNTAKQLLIYKALGYAPPQFGHMAMILGPDRAKLSKRHGTVSVRQFAEEGYLPHALFNYMALLGWSPGDEREKMTQEEIVRDFSLERLNKAAAIFDFKKLRWMNANYIRELSQDDFLAAVRPFIPDYETLAEKYGEPWLRDAVWLFHDNLEVLGDIGPKLAQVASFNPTDEATQMFAEPESRAVLAAFREELGALGADKLPLTIEVIDPVLSDIQAKTGAKGRKLYMPLRAAMIGSPHGPDIRVVGPMLGRDELIRRLTLALGA
jgi:nondiscriminating glutamyl-tRNA synthetase